MATKVAQSFPFCVKLGSSVQAGTPVIIIIIIIIIIIKTLFQEGNTISTELISLAALKYLQVYIVDE